MEENKKDLDRLFALIYTVLGYGFVYLFTGGTFAPGIAAFTVCYILTILAYLFIKKVKPAPESWFWMIVILSSGMFYNRWSIFPLLQFIGLIVAAAYWTLTATGNLIEEGRTSSFVFYDGLNAFIIVPFRNFFCHFNILIHGSRDFGHSENKFGRGVWPVVLGIIISIPVLVVILPLLSSADSQFEGITEYLYSFIGNHVGDFFMRLLLSLPVTAYLFGLVYGGIHHKNTDHFSEDTIRGSAAHLRTLPDTAVHTVNTIMALVYLLFIAIQGRYLFSAFAGIRPEGFTFSEYARRGFFELCVIAVINLVILIVSNSFSKNPFQENVWLKRETVLLSALTILLLATAMSKLLLYISAYGLTELRVLSLTFLIWMFLVFLLIIISRYKNIPLVRISVIAGAVLFCLLCAIPISKCIKQYNLIFHY